LNSTEKNDSEKLIVLKMLIIYSFLRKIFSNMKILKNKWKLQIFETYIFIV